MPREITMPKLGLTMTHGKVTRWLKKEGDPVKAGEVVAEIETDKINSEVESPFDGYLVKILVNEGEEKEIAAPICMIGEKDDISRMQRAEQESDTKKNAGPRVFITPVAKKLAIEKGVDYTSIKGTGPGGRIVEKDILRVLQESVADSGATKESAGVLQESVPDGKATKETAGENRVKKVPLAGIRKTIAGRLTQSKRDIPHVYFKISVDAGNMLELKNKIAGGIEAKAGKKPSINDMIIKAVAVALKEFPDFNASLVNDEILYYSDINIGIAVDTDRGLVVPVVRNADKQSLSEICRSAGELVGKARAGKLLPDDMAGGTFTISNLGAYHIDEFFAIVNPPESAILAVGRAQETPVVRNGEVVVRPVMSLSVSVDHRVIDGALAAKFMKRLKDLLENPYLILI